MWRHETSSSNSLCFVSLIAQYNCSFSTYWVLFSEQVTFCVCVYIYIYIYIYKCNIYNFFSIQIFQRKKFVAWADQGKLDSQFSRKNVKISGYCCYPWHAIFWIIFNKEIVSNNLTANEDRETYMLLVQFFFKTISL